MHILTYIYTHSRLSTLEKVTGRHKPRIQGQSNAARGLLIVSSILVNEQIFSFKIVGSGNGIE